MKKRANIYRYTTKRNGEEVAHVKVKVSPREAKSYIMKTHGWTKEEYQKKYDIFKNKLRALEAFERAHGKKDVKAQSPVELLYKQAKSMNLYGPDYKKSIKMQRIESFQSISMGKKGREALKNKKYVEKYESVFSSYTDTAFKGFIEAVPKAKEIYNSIKDPIKREEALAAFADKLHAKIDEEGKREQDDGIPFSGESVGSDIEVDFDYSEYQINNDNYDN